MSRTPAERISLGARAESELSMTSRAFAEVRQSLLEAIADTPLEQREQREMLYLAVNLLPQLRQVLVAYVTDAVAAKAEINIAEAMAAADERRAPREFN